MKKRLFSLRKMGRRIVVVALAIGVTFVSLQPRVQSVSSILPFPALNAIYTRVNTEFLNKKVNPKELEYGAIKGLLTVLKDPYTRFLDPKRYAEMRARLDGHFTGIGISLGVSDNQLVVIAPFPNSSAEKAGIKPLDKIIQIDRSSTEGMPLEEAVGRIRGREGTSITLKLMRRTSDNIMVVKLVRTKVKIHAVNKVMWFGDIGYIRLVTFENYNAAKEVAKAIENLQKKPLKALIFDLRNNGGGLLNNAVDISSFFIPEGAVVHRVDRDGQRHTEYVSGRVKYEGPLFVLINHGSASASEIVAGAIQDHHRGKIVGENSYGKATVQKIIELQDGSALLLTFSKYLTPNGRDISKKGISLDFGISIPQDKNVKIKFIDSYLTDYQLQEAIKLARQQ